MRFGPLGLSLGVALFLGCYPIPALEGLYRCERPEDCVEPGQVCRMGQCCSENGEGEPRCLAACADGEESLTFWPDVDGDGYGQSSAPGRTACDLPAGYVLNNQDCDDGSAGINPAQLDVCGSGIDNNCSGTGDESPDCGGPLNLIALDAPQKGAFNAGRRWDGTPSSCLKGLEGSSPEEINSANVWTGAGPTSHVLFFEAERTWDLSKANLGLRLRFTYNLANPGSPAAWAQHKQPIVMLCGESGFIRFVPRMGSADDAATPLMPNALGTVDTTLYVGRSSEADWVTSNSFAERNLVLPRVKRVEIMIEPASDGVNTPAFSVELLEVGFQ